MSSAIISLLFGFLSLVSAVPVVFPVFGLALGVNAILKERKKTDTKKSVIVLATIGLVMNSFIASMFILKGLLR